MKPATFSLLTGRARPPRGAAANEQAPAGATTPEQATAAAEALAAATAAVTEGLIALKEQLAELASTVTARMETLETSMRAVADKAPPTISVPPSPPPVVTIPPMPSYKKEIDQINATLAVLIARTTPIQDSAPPAEISFDLVKNGLGDIVSIIARKN